MMRHFTKTLNKSVALVLSLALLTPLLFALLTVAGIGTPTASAAISDSAATKACKAYLAKLNNVSADDIPNDFRDLEPCKVGYKAGYDNVNQNDTSKACTTSSKNQGMCINAYKLGQSDAKKASGTKQPSAAQIKTAAQKACKPWNDQEGVSKDDRTKNYTACVAGYTGQKNGKSTTDACRSYSGVANKACLQGHDNAVNGARVVPTSGGAGTAGQQSSSSSNTSSDGSGEDDSKLDCDLGVESTFGDSSSNVANTASNAAYMFNPFNWAFCGVTKALVGMVDWLDSSINSMLSVGSPGNSSEPSQIFATSSGRCADGGACQGYYQAWESFRNIALGLMVIAGLLVLIGQALGMEILDAYTIRKVLPRLLIAAIGITLSWQFMHFAVELTNDLGYGIRRLIYSPFSELDGQIGINFGDSFALVILGGIGWFITGAAYMMLLVGTALLSLFIAFLILVLREIIILALIIFAPIAIVCYILPNTQKVWKLWQNSFLGALLMFPLISAFIALGRVFSTVALTGDNSLLQSSVGFMAYFVPYFMIAKTPQYAGGAVGQIGGFVNGASQGMFQGLGKKRRAISGERTKAMRSGGLYRNDFMKFKMPETIGGKKLPSRIAGKETSLSKMANTAGAWSLDFDEQARVKAGETRLGRGLFGRSSDIMKSEIMAATIQQSGKAMQESNMHYQAGRAAAGLHGYYASGLDAGARKQLDTRYGTEFETYMDDSGVEQRRATAWRAPEGKNELEDVATLLSSATGTSTAAISAREAGQGLGANAAYLGNLKGAGKEETQRADTRLVGLMSAAKAGRLESKDITANHNAIMDAALATGDAVKIRDAREQSSRETALLQDLSAPKRPSLGRGYGIEFKADGRAEDMYADPTSDKAQDSIARQGTQDLNSMKSEELDLDKGSGQAWAAALSEYEMAVDPDSKEIKIVTENGERIRKTSQKAIDRARAVKAELKGAYDFNYGDADVRRKLEATWVAAGHELEELRSRGVTPDRRVADQQQQQQQQGNQGQDQGGGPGGPPS